MSLAIIVTLDVSPILTFKARKWLVFPLLPCLIPPAQLLIGNELKFLAETYPAKTRGVGCGGANFIIQLRF